MRRTGLAALLLLTACGGSEPEPVAQPGPDTFITEARAMNFGNAELRAMPEDRLLSLGNLACTGLSNGTLTIGQVVEGYVTSDAKPTTAEAEGFTRSAVRNLCPQHAKQLPN